MPRLGNEKLKNITPPMLDSLFAQLQKSGNMEQHFKLKDKSLFNGMTRQDKHLQINQELTVQQFIIYCVEEQLHEKMLKRYLAHLA